MMLMNDLWTIEERLQALEAQAHKAPSTNHGERLTVLENAVKELQSHLKVYDAKEKIKSVNSSDDTSE